MLKVVARLPELFCGFEPDVPRIVLRRPRLPDYIVWLRIGPLSIRQRSVELLLRRYERTVGIDGQHRRGDLEISVIA